MKTWWTIGLVALWVTGGAAAANLTWDAAPNGGQADDGPGSWTSSSAFTNWWDGAQNAPWPNTSGDTAVFGAGSGTAGVVTVSGTVTANGLVFTNAGRGVYRLDGGTIELAGLSPTMRAATNATVGAGLAGSAGLRKTGGGILTLEGGKSYSGATAVAEGTLRIAPVPPVLPLFWLDASDEGTMVYDANRKVNAWISKGSYAGSVTAAGDARPTFTPNRLNGQSVVAFDQTRTNRLQNTGLLTAGHFPANSATLFVVWTVTNESGYVVLNTGQASEHWRYYANGYGYFGLFRSSRVEQKPANMPINGSHVLALTTAGSAVDAYKMWIDGQSVMTTNSSWSIGATLTLGGNPLMAGGNPMNGSIAEVLVYNSVLSDAERLAVEAYLNRKWLASGATAAGHVLPVGTALSVASGATLDLGGFHQTVASLSNVSGSGGHIALGKGTLTVGDAGTSVFSGSISGYALTIFGGGSLVKTGAGTQVLTGTHTYSGGTTVSAGTLVGHAASLQGDMMNNGTLVFTQAVDGAYAGVIGGSGGLVKTGGGTLSFGSDQTYTGTTEICAGTLQIGAPGAPLGAGGALLLWLDAADLSTVTRDGFGRVSAWASKGAYVGSVVASGNNRPTYIAGALAGKGVVRFDQTISNRMSNVGLLTNVNFSNHNATVFAVWTVNGSDPRYTVLNTGDPNEWWRFNGPGYLSTFRAIGSRLANLPASMPNSGSHLLTVATQGALANSYRVWLDGSQVVTANPAWWLGTTLSLGWSADVGSGTLFNGDMAEILIYNTVLSEAQRQTVETYLKTKWQLGGGVARGIGLQNSRRVTVNGGTLWITSVTNSVLSTNTFVDLVSGGAYLGAGVTQAVGRLRLGGVEAAVGTWGGSGSGADRIDPVRFTGTGVLDVRQILVHSTVIQVR